MSVPLESGVIVYALHTYTTIISAALQTFATRPLSRESVVEERTTLIKADLNGDEKASALNPVVPSTQQIRLFQPPLSILRSRLQ